MRPSYHWLPLDIKILYYYGRRRIRDSKFQIGHRNTGIPRGRRWARWLIAVRNTRKRLTAMSGQVWPCRACVLPSCECIISFIISIYNQWLYVDDTRRWIILQNYALFDRTVASVSVRQWYAHTSVRCTQYSTRVPNFPLSAARAPGPDNDNRRFLAVSHMLVESVILFPARVFVVLTSS